MNISSHEEYGLRCAIRLAKAYQAGPIAASKIAELEGLSVEYVSKLLHMFRKAGIVSSVRGVQGGFRLVKTPENLRLQEVLKALASKNSSRDFCNHFSGQNEVCANIGNCSARPIWSMMTFAFQEVLGQMLLSELLQPEIAVKKRIVELFLGQLENFQKARNDPRSGGKSPIDIFNQREGSASSGSTIRN